MRKNSIVTCYVTFCLLCTVPQNQGAKLLERLNCIRPYPLKNLTCTWIENNISGKLVNMTLKELHKNESACAEKIVTRSSLTHTTWTCDVKWGGWVESDFIKFNFVPERNLETRLNIVEEKDEAKPQNLHCSHTDGNITCTWLVRKEIAESIDFDLFYDNDEKECQPKCQEISEFLSCYCNITTNGHLNTSALLKTIAVKPSKSSHRSFRLCLIYQLPPRNLIINESKTEEVFLVTWKNPTTEKSDFKYFYELCYWNQGDLKLKEVPDICPDEPKKLENSHDPSAILRLGEHLKTGSNYSLMVRVQLKEKSTWCYQGPWSQWSNVQTLTTKAAPNLIVLYILIPICVIILVMFAVCGYRALARYTKKWDEMIPNPNKSSIIKSLQKTKIESCLPYEDHLYVEPYNNILMWASSGSKESSHVYHNEQHISQPGKELFPEEDTECFNLCDPTKKDYPTASIVDGYKPFTDFTNEQESKEREDSQFTFSAFDGPYLFSESNLS